MNGNNRSLRHTILGRRDNLLQAEQIEKSERILANLLELPVVQQSSLFFVYVHFRSEVQTVPFIEKCLQKKKIVTVPVTRESEKILRAIRITDVTNDLEPGYCGIPEPNVMLQQTVDLDPSSIDVVIVPGSVFDHRGGRLGYGGGYYDRFLAREASQATRIALAYELQLIDALQLEPHDQLMDWIITEKNSYSCKRG